jgi:hypothetical protein
LLAQWFVHDLDVAITTSELASDTSLEQARPLRWRNGWRVARRGSWRCRWGARRAGRRCLCRASCFCCCIKCCLCFIACCTICDLVGYHKGTIAAVTAKVDSNRVGPDYLVVVLSFRQLRPEFGPLSSLTDCILALKNDVHLVLKARRQLVR